MTAAFLQSELSTLISESRRKHGHIRVAAEKSLSELKSISVTSETQLAGDLLRRPTFVEPFVLACRSQNAKLASVGAACIHRLVASTAIPRPRLLDVLQAFEDAVSLTLEVQLKILQTLPSLLQLYASDLHGETLARMLSVSADLSSSKLPLVSNTAGATFQQLVSAVFSRTSSSAGSPSRPPDSSNSPQENEDASAIFVDLCGLLTSERPQFVRLNNLPPQSILETLEGLLSLHGKLIMHDGDSLKACHDYLLPGLQALIDGSVNYGIVARSIRITFILASQHIERLQSSMDELLGIVLKVVDRPGSQKWKRVLGLEFLRGLCSDFDLLRSTFAIFDLKGDNKKLVSDFMASLVRIASEDPVLIGLGRQSTIPASKTSETPNNLPDTSDVPTGNVGSSDTVSVGLSKDFSTIATPCLDQFDRTTAPDVPDTYIFTLVLSCTSSLTDGLSKFIMPLSVPTKRTSKHEVSDVEVTDENEPQRRSSTLQESARHQHSHLINPLTRPDLNKRHVVEQSAQMIEACWPAVLAICSTFLNAALDAYFYHMLIRTVQKLTQVAGVLELSTPRDALLTTLAKVSVPVNVTTQMNSFYGTKPATQGHVDAQPAADDSTLKSPVASTPRESVDLSSQSLNVRNLLCLRALLNLAIALGPSLSHSAWTIILQSLQQVEALMSVGPAARILQLSQSANETQESGPGSSLASEVAAMDTARRRMFDSTTAYSSPAFKVLCESLFRMIDDVLPQPPTTLSRTSSSNDTLNTKMMGHKSTRSVSGSWAKSATLEVDVQFVLKSIGRIASVNLDRFRHLDTTAESWDLIVAKLLLLQENRPLQAHLRLQAVNIVDAIVVGSCSSSQADEDDLQEPDTTTILLRYGIPALGKQAESVRKSCQQGHKCTETDTKTLSNMLEALENLIGAHGDELGAGWTGVFTILNMIVTEPLGGVDSSTSAALLPAVFKVVQLVASDFLPVLDEASIMALLQLYDVFGAQQLDLNMALTTIALFWNISGLMIKHNQQLPPFSGNRPHPTAAATAGNKAGNEIWQGVFYSLAGLCQDERANVRNAAMRMLTKIIDTTIPRVSSSTFNTLLEQIIFPLLKSYSTLCVDSAGGWKDSLVSALRDVVELFQHNSKLFLQDAEFTHTWTSLGQVLASALEVRDAGLMTNALDAISDIITCVAHVDVPITSSEVHAMIAVIWNLWCQNQPASNHLTKGANQALLASHLRLWSELAAWNVEQFSGFENTIKVTEKAVKDAIFAARHEQYTIDVSRLSAEQEQAFRILKTLRLMMTERKIEYAQLLVDLAQGLVDRTIANMASPTSNTTARQPSGIAFAAACVDELRIVLAQNAEALDVWRAFPLKNVLDLSTSLVRTKYSTLPSNPQDPLWQKASQLGTDCVTAIGNRDDVNVAQFAALGPSRNALVTAVIETQYLDELSTDARPAMEQLSSDESFDITQLQRLHSASSFYNSSAITEPVRKQYILTLFTYSLVAKPWYNDLAHDLYQEPLKDLTNIRRGSIRAPELPIRRRIYQEVLRCLFDRVKRHDANQNASTDAIAYLAAPYVLLRLAHSLKTFIADQPLRYLEHPHPILQEDLQLILRTFLDLRVVDDAFTESAQYLTANAGTNNYRHSGNAFNRQDGKSHLRIMFGLVLRFEELWFSMPRLKKGYAWQDGKRGAAIEQCLREWKEAIGEGWGPSFR